MRPRFRTASFAHSIRSDGNNGNAHFLLELMRNLIVLGHDGMILEPEYGWSVSNLRTEALGERALRQFEAAYSELLIRSYSSNVDDIWEETLRGRDIVIIHEWNPPALA